MADTPKTETHNIDEVQKAFEKQLLELRREIAKINKSISERGTELADEARDVAAKAYDGASARASRASQQLRTQAQSVSEIARKNPRTTTAALGIAGCIGFLIGIAVAKGLSDKPRHWY